MGMGRPATAGVRGAGSFNSSAATISVACPSSDENGHIDDMIMEQWLSDDE